MLPFSISSGFVSITLLFILTQAGFSVAIAASIVAIGVSANLWRFRGGPAVLASSLIKESATAFLHRT